MTKLMVLQVKALEGCMDSEIASKIRLGEVTNSGPGYFKLRRCRDGHHGSEPAPCECSSLCTSWPSHAASMLASKDSTGRDTSQNATTSKGILHLRVPAKSR